jgi:hypothetical protein
VVSLLVLAPLGSAALALDLDEWIPGLKVSPFYSQKVEYESNVFQVPSHSEDDVIFKMIPGFLADYTFGPHSVSVGYRAEILKYVELTNQDTVNHFAVGQIRLDFPRTLLTLREDFARTNAPPGTELTGPIISNTNILRPEAEYRLTSKFSLGANFTWTDVRFDDDSTGDLINRDEYLGGAAFFWKFTPNADLGLYYNYGRVLFETSTDRDYTDQIVSIGFRGDITAKLSSTLRIGVLLRDPDSSSQPGWLGFVMYGDTTYKPTERTTFTLSVLRAPQESTFGDNPFYVTTSATLSATQQILPKLSVTARLGGGINDYVTKQTADGMTDWRNDQFLVAGAQIDYDIQPWLRVGLEYSRTSRNSNFPSFRFVDDKVAGRATLQF